MKRTAFLGALAAATLTPTLGYAASPPRSRIELGDDVLVADAWHALRGRRIGIITNQSGVTSELISVVDAVHRKTSLHITALFAPEHGLRGDQPAGHYVASYRDPQTDLPVYSLYGPTRIPNASMLADVDVLLFDIQDVGDRAYTFISTMAEAMKAAKAHGKELWILDRPNPIGGHLVEGPVLEPAYESFIGMYPIAMRHGMTIGELAQLYNGHFGIGCALHVVPMRGWQRTMLWNDTGLAWVATSPMIPTWETTLVYPGTGLIDNAGINNGVGTAKPFFYAGGYEFDSAAFARRLNARNLPGVYFREAAWSPFAGFWKNKELRGVELTITDPKTFLSVRTGLEIIAAAHAIAPHGLRWNVHGIDLDWGTDSVRRGILANESPEQIEASWSHRLADFRTVRAKYVITAYGNA